MRSISTRTVAFITLGLAVAVVVQAAGLFRQNLLFTRAQTEVSFWGRGDYRPDEVTILDTSKLLNGLLESKPHHPDYLGLQANKAVWLAYWSGPGAAGEHSSRQAIGSQYAALVSRPAHRHSWVKMVEYLSRGEVSEQNVALADLAQARLIALTL